MASRWAFDVRTTASATSACLDRGAERLLELLLVARSSPPDDLDQHVVVEICGSGGDPFAGGVVTIR